eukprot:m.66482 g.66482  ORF g.66482 m.66482 type:complete len:349 (+) comp19726_c0_seq1:37-1083(+)
MSVRRGLKNVVKKYSKCERDVREATSNDAWGAPGTLLAKIADQTHNLDSFHQIMAMIWKRLDDSGKNWRHVYKGLTLLEYLCKTGAEHVAPAVRENIFAVQTLKDFQYLDANNKDQGLNVRERAKAIISLLEDEERLQDERVRALKAKERLQGPSSVSANLKKNSKKYASPPPATASLDPHQSSPSANEDPIHEDTMVEVALQMSRAEAERQQQEQLQEEEQLRQALELSKLESQSQDPWGGQPEPVPSQGFEDNAWGTPSTTATAAHSIPPPAQPDPFVTPNKNPDAMESPLNWNPPSAWTPPSELPQAKQQETNPFLMEDAPSTNPFAPTSNEKPTENGTTVNPFL